MGEIASALGSRGKRDLADRRTRAQKNVMCPKEEQLASAFVEPRPRDENRTTDRIPGILEAIGWLRDSVPIIVPVVRVKHLVAPKVVPGSVELVGAVLDRDAHLAARTRAEFRLRAGQIHSHFPYGVDIRRDEAGACHISDILVGHAIEGNQELSGLSAVHLGGTVISGRLGVAAADVGAADAASAGDADAGDTGWGAADAGAAATD